LKLAKGTIEKGRDADVLVMDKHTLAIKYVFARGEVLKTPTWVKKGMFEP